MSNPSTPSHAVEASLDHTTNPNTEADPMADFAAPNGPDPKAASTSYELDGFKMDASHADMASTEAEFDRVPAKKPEKEDWIWAMGKPWHFPGYLHISGLDETPYLLTPGVARGLDPSLVRRVTFVAYVNTYKVWALWPVPMVNEDGTTNSWHVSAREIAFGKTGQWLRVKSSRHHSAYLTIRAPAQLPPPEPPPVDMMGLVKIAFRDRMISDAGHEVLRRARGEII